MKILKMPRRSGKTTMLIIEANLKKATIICWSEISKRYINQMAEQMKLKIPEPVVVVPQEKLRGRHHQVMLIDDLDLVLNTLFCGNVETVTFTPKD